MKTAGLLILYSRLSVACDYLEDGSLKMWVSKQALLLPGEVQSPQEEPSSIHSHPLPGDSGNDF